MCVYFIVIYIYIYISPPQCPCCGQAVHLVLFYLLKKKTSLLAFMCHICTFVYTDGFLRLFSNLFRLFCPPLPLHRDLSLYIIVTTFSQATVCIFCSDVPFPPKAVSSECRCVERVEWKKGRRKKNTNRAVLIHKKC